MLLKAINAAMENETKMASWDKQNAKILKKKEDFFVDKLRLMSIIEGDLQFLFRIIMKCRLHDMMEERKLLSIDQGGGRRERCIDNEAMLTRMAFD